MSDVESDAPSVNDPQQSVISSPIMMNGKAAAAAPKLTAEDASVEMRTMLSASPAIPADRDIMQLARLGDVPAIQKLFDAGIFHPTYCDEEGITPLHV